MANVLKYLTGVLSKRAKRKGNLAVGIGEENYGPSSTTGYYAGVTPPENGFVVYTLGVNNNPKAFYAETEDDLRAIARTLGGGKLDILESKNYIAGLANTWVLNNTPNNVVTDGLVLDINAKNPTSFVNNEPTTNNINGGSNRADGVDDIWYRGSHAGNSTAVVVNEFYSVERPHIIRAYSTNTTGYYMFNQKSAIQNQSGSRYSYSFDYKQLSGDTFTPTMNVYGNGYKVPDSSNYYANISYQYIPLSDGWTRFVGTYDATYTGYNTYRINMNTNNSVDYEILFDNFQVEEGEGTNFTTGSRSQTTAVYDLSGQGNNGTLQNGVTFEGNGFGFDGTNDRILLNSYNNLRYGGTISEVDFSIEGVFKLDTVARAPIYDYYRYGVQVLDNGQVGVWYNGNGGVWDAVYGGSLSANTWYHVVGIHEEGVANKIYINGELINTDNSPVNIYGSSYSYNGPYIGYTSHVGGVLTDGEINSVRVYNKSLTDIEIQQNYYGGPIVTNGLIFAADAGNLVSYESGSTTAYNLTGSINGTLTNGVGFDPQNGGTWVFDGSNDYITFGNNTATNFYHTDAFSLEAWIKPSAFAGFDTIIGGGYGNYRLAQNSNTLTFRLDSNNLIVEQASLLQLNEWQHVAATYDPNTFTAAIYHNGKFIKQGTDATLNWATTTNFGIGMSVGESNAYYFPGNIALGRVYNKTLSDSEVLQNYNAQKARFGI